MSLGVINHGMSLSVLYKPMIPQSLMPSKLLMRYVVMVMIQTYDTTELRDGDLILWLSITCAPIDILPPIKRLALPVLPVDF
jgi:glycyl-tRNA synthetase (class II)